MVVIDDCSSDDTSHVAERAGATVIRLTSRVGAWRAIQAGIRYALKANFTCALTMDADGQHLADTLLRLRNGISNRVSVVIGSCPSRACKKRRMGWLFFRTLTGLRIEDLTSGLRVYDHAALKLLSSRQARSLEYQDIGVLMLLRSGGFEIQEIYVPMEGRVTGRSRTYHSWMAICYYLLKTTLICVRKKKLVE